MDYEIIKYNGQSIKWQNFKEDNFPNWSFDSLNKINVQNNRDKNVIIWNLIGKELC